MREHGIQRRRMLAESGPESRGQDDRLSNRALVPAVDRKGRRVQTLRARVLQPVLTLQSYPDIPGRHRMTKSGNGFFQCERGGTRDETTTTLKARRPQPSQADRDPERGSQTRNELHDLGRRMQAR